MFYKEVWGQVCDRKVQFSKLRDFLSGLFSITDVTYFWNTIKAVSFFFLLNSGLCRFKVYLNENISWKTHILAVPKKIRTSVEIVYNLKYYFNTTNLIKVYHPTNFKLFTILHATLHENKEMKQF